MAKTKTPFLSLGSSGTVGGVLTSQKSGGDTILRKTPVPTDPYSLAQAYQRWDYRDYAYLWTLLTNSQKQVYRTRASRYHITGFSQFMREKLKTLPDLAGRWRLDNIIGTQVLDSSKNTNHGTVFGAVLTDGVIDRALYFDGLDDYINAGHDPTIDFSGSFSIEFFITFHSWSAWEGLLTKYSESANYVVFQIPATLQVGLWVRKNNISNVTLVTPLLSLETSYHITATFDTPNTTCQLFFNGDYHSQDLTMDLPDTLATDLIFGSRTASTARSNITLDQIVFYNRLEDATEIKRHSERRYP